MNFNQKPVPASGNRKNQSFKARVLIQIFICTLFPPTSTLIYSQSLFVQLRTKKGDSGSVSSRSYLDIMSSLARMSSCVCTLAVKYWNTLYLVLSLPGYYVQPGQDVQLTLYPGCIVLEDPMPGPVTTWILCPAWPGCLAVSAPWMCSTGRPCAWSCHYLDIMSSLARMSSCVCTLAV